jgi:hypothetical protein
MPAPAIDTGVYGWITRHDAVKDEQGRHLVVWNGYHPTGTVVTGVAPAIEKYEEKAAERVLLECLTRQDRHAIGAAPHVRWPEANQDPNRRGQRRHPPARAGPDRVQNVDHPPIRSGNNKWWVWSVAQGVPIQRAPSPKQCPNVQYAIVEARDVNSPGHFGT